MFNKSIARGIILFLLISSFNTVTSSYETTSNSSIQEMIDNANHGDTIYVSAGTYYEHLVVDKPLTIIGDGAESTIVDGMGLDEHVFTIVSDNVDISGFTIMNCSIGFSGIRVYNDSCNIHNNIFRMCGGGVEPRNVEDVNIHNNTIEENIWGIFIHSSMDCSINDNIIRENIYGMELGYSTAEIKNNIIKNNDLYGMFQLWCNQVTIISNTYSYNDFAIQTYNSNGNIIRDNYVNHNQRGISLFNSSDNQIKNNNIRNNGRGVYLWRESNNNQIIYNEIYSNAIGIYIAESNYNNISNNNILNSADKGVGLIYSSDNTISKNKIISECFDGIELVYSPYNSIIKNNISNHLLHGIHIISSPYTTIKDNIFNRNSFRIYGGEIYTYSEVFQNLSVKLKHWNTHTIENNTISGMKIIYYKNENDVDIPNDFGEVIFANCSNITIENFDIKNADCGIQIGFSKDIQIIDNNISNNSRTGIFIAFSSNVLIQNNNIADLWGAGMDLFHLKGEINIIGNNIIRTGAAIWMVASNNTYIAENIIKGSSKQDDWGCINLFYSSNNSIIKNNISENQAVKSGIILAYNSNNQIIQSNNINNISITGIVLFQSSNNIIIKNNITGNGGNGVFLSQSSRNTISYNNISHNKYPGIALGYSSNRNSISRNKIEYNLINGIIIKDSSKYNIIKENNIISNDYPAYFRYAYPNFWLSNYWDDWDKALPRPIYGEIRLERLDMVVPWVQFDWKPAREPYDIP